MAVKQLYVPGTLLKFGERKYMESLYHEGKVHFSPPSSFRSSGQQGLDDPLDSRLVGHPSEVAIYPYVDGKINLSPENKVPLKNVKELTLIQNGFEQVPIACFYEREEPLINRLFRLPNYEEITAGFPRYDTAVVIFYPLLFLHRLQSKITLYADRVHYSDESLSQEFDSDDLKTMFYKQTRYAYQKEYRILINGLSSEKPVDVVVGSLEDISFLVDIQALKQGIVLCDETTSFEEVGRSPKPKNGE